MEILIADSHDHVRFALRVMLSRQPGLQVVGEAADGAELLALARTAMADLAIVDWALPGLAGVGGMAAIHQACHALHLIVLSSQLGIRQAAVGNGVDAFVSKGDPPDRLLAVIRQYERTAG
jgi:DNA-binding NarL/FixJ family response regulator